MRLDKLLADAGAGTRKQVKAMISGGRVTLSDEVVKKPGTIIDPACHNIKLDGQPVLYSKYIYIMLNKPAGVLSATEDARIPTVLGLIPPALRRAGLFPAGRLDKDTEGLLILTNDGASAHRTLAPKYRCPKVYYARLDAELAPGDCEIFANGIQLDNNYTALPATLEIIDKFEARITVFEGKYHQIKRMFEAIGKKVLYLRREEFAGIKLDKALKTGGFRLLSSQETEKFIMQ